MPFTLADAQNILRLARFYYKGTYKSANKRYMGTNDPRTGLADSNRARRNSNAVRAMAQIQQTRAQPMGGGYEGVGKYLRDNDITTGNCGEMSAVVCRICREQLGGAPVIEVGWAGQHSHSADHMFVMISDAGARAHMFDTIKDMHEYPLPGFWIVDCWMNIACASVDYMRLAQQKAAKWSGEQKVIWLGGNNYMQATQFVEAVLDEEIDWTPAPAL